MTFEEIQEHAIYQMANARVRPHPFPHFLVENLWPLEFYMEILNALPETEIYSDISKVRELGGPKKGEKVYKDRMVVPLHRQGIDGIDEQHRGVWETVAGIMCGEDFARALLQKFAFALDLKGQELMTDLLLIRDRKGYKIGPHSDHPQRVAVLISYLPKFSGREHLGTSIYVPKKKGFTCEGGPHYPRRLFHKVFTAPYTINTALGFLKTPNSFHGVDPVTEDVERDLLHYFLRQKVEDNGKS